MICTSCKHREAKQGRRTCEPCLEHSRQRPTISIHKDTYVPLRDFAKANGMSMSGIVEHLVESELGPVAKELPMGTTEIMDAGGPLVLFFVSRRTAELVGGGNPIERSRRFEDALNRAIDAAWDAW